MTGDLRRQSILRELSNAEKPIAARKFAESFKLSRQIIVGDIALLRAEGHPILATNKGYLIKEESNSGVRKYLAMHHGIDETRLELEIFVKHGVIVESVTVEHPVYGEITGQLNIKTREDIDDFLSQKAELLSALTEGIHIHTVLCKNEENYIEVKKELAENNLLYQSNESIKR